MNIPEESWMRKIEDKVYEDEIFHDSKPIGHPHFMKCEHLNKMSKRDIESFWSLKAQTQSMLSPETLCLINYFSSISSGTILEIGAFTGGATISAGLGMGNSLDRRLISMECCGHVQNNQVGHSTARSTGGEEPFAVLESNIDYYGLTQKIDLFKTWSDDPKALEQIIPALKKDPIGVLIIDADGELEKHLEIYLKYVKKGGYLIFDDYVMEIKFRTGMDKSKPVQKKVHQLINGGIARSLGVYAWSTWFGQKL